MIRYFAWILMTASFYCQEVDRFQVERSIIQSASNSEITNKIKDICNDHKYLIRPTGNDNCIFGVDDGFIGCPIHYYVFWFDSINFKCKRCQNNKLSATSISSFNELCNIENTYDIAKAFDYGKDFSLKPCEYLVNNSIERLEGTPPISIYCNCYDSAPRVFSKSKRNHHMQCSNLEQRKIIAKFKILDYIVVNTFQNDGSEYVFFNCNPYREDSNIFEKCLCPPGQIYIDLKCKQCTENDPIDPSKQHKCARCDSNKILTPDGFGCMCPYSDSPQNENCETCSQTESANCYCSGNFYVKDGKCTLCEGIKIICKETNSCLCPFSENLLDDDCNVCQESKNKDSCGCKGNSTKVGSSCKCLENQILLNQLFCSDCENLKVPSLDKTRCVCPEGKFPNQDKECKSCPKGSFSNTTDSKSCTECRFLKTTQGSNSKSIKDCNVFETSKFFAFILAPFFGIVSLIIASIWIIWINSRKKNSSINQINNHNVNSRGSDRRVSKNYEHMVQNNAEISVPVNQKILELKGDYQYAKMDQSNSQDCSGNQYCSQVTIPYEDRK